MNRNLNVEKRIATQKIELKEEEDVKDPKISKL